MMTEFPEAADSRSQGEVPTGEPRLLRALGRPEAVAMVVGNVIGSGIFFKPPQIAADVGSVPVALAAWILGGILCLLGASCVAELSAMFPRAGGLYVYIREAYGKLPAFLYGWTEFWVLRPAAIGALATVLTLPLPVPEAVRLSISVAVVVLLGWVNIMGVVWGGLVQNVTTLIKAGFLAGIAVLPLVLGGWEVEHFSSVLSTEPNESGLVGFGLALLAVLWAYNGWHEVTPLAEEIVDPQRNIPWALFAGVGILTALYVGVNVAYHGVLSMDELAEQKNAATGLMNRLFGPVGGRIMTGLVMCSVFGGINSVMLQSPGIFYAMGRDRCFFSFLGRVHAVRRTPAYSIGAQTTLAVVLLVFVRFIPHGEIAQPLKAVPAGLEIPSDRAERWSLRPTSTSGAGETRVSPGQEGTLAFEGTPMGWKEKTELESLSEDGDYRDALQALYDRSNKQTFESLTNFFIFGASIFYVLTVAAVIILRRRLPDLARPYRTWGYPWVPVAFLTVYVWFLATIAVARPWESGIGLALIATGVPAYLLWIRRSAA